MGSPKTGAARLSLFLVKSTFISISSQFNPRQPGWCSAHLLTDGVEGCVLADFDDKLVVDVADDAAVRQRPHGVAQDIPADCLGNVLAELRPIALNAGPVLGAVHAHVGDALAAKAVHTDLGLDVGQAASARKRDEQHPVTRLEANASDLGRNLLLDGGLHGVVHVPPVLHDARVRAAPHGDQWLKLVLGQAHL